MTQTASTDLQQRYQLAIELGRQAGELALDLFTRREQLQVEKKGRQDFVSEADRAVETLIRQQIANSFPDDGMLGEEFGITEGKQGLWVIDPIDGTTNFLRGLEHWSVSIAYWADHQIQIGVVSSPCSESLYHAQKGQGAFCNQTKLHVLDDMLHEDILIGAGSFHKHLDELMPFLRQCKSNLRCFGSAALAIAQTAQGALDAYYQKRLRSWDALAGLLIAREAGRKTIGFDSTDSLQQKELVLVCAEKLLPPFQDWIQGQNIL